MLEGPRAIEHAGAVVRRRSAWGTEPLGADEVVVVDVPGELASWYGMALVAFVGGSLVPVGGHNLYEPAAAGALVVHGPHTGEVTEAAMRLAGASASEVVATAGELASLLDRALSERERTRERGRRGARALAEQRGGAQRAIRWMDERCGVGRGGHAS